MNLRRAIDTALEHSKTAEEFADVVAKPSEDLLTGMKPTEEERQQMNERRDKYIQQESAP
jgi:hypothetical protein